MYRFVKSGSNSLVAIIAVVAALLIPHASAACVETANPDFGAEEICAAVISVPAIISSNRYKPAPDVAQTTIGTSLSAKRVFTVRANDARNVGFCRLYCIFRE